MAKSKKAAAKAAKKPVSTKSKGAKSVKKTVSEKKIKVKPTANSKPASAGKVKAVAKQSKASKAKPAARPSAKAHVTGKAALKKAPSRAAAAPVKPAVATPPTSEKPAGRPRRRKIIPITSIAPKPIPQTPVAKLAELKSKQAATLKRPLPQRPEVMPQAQTTSSVKGRTRYSDKELAEFKSIILEKLEQAKNDLNYLQEQIGQKGDSDSGISETTFASSDDGSTSMEREYLVQMASRLRKYIDHLDKALVRIENKTYGICRVTGKLIEKERLMAVPHATLSMEGKRLESHAPQHQEGG